MALLAEMKIVHAHDPLQAIVEAVGPELDNIEVISQYVLLGKYVREAGMMTTGGIEIPQEVVKDDRYQTKVGLVLKIGLTAFKDDEHVKFHGWRPNLLDWVAYRPSDGMTLQIGRHECRLIPDVQIKLRLKHPDAIF
jgi:hypothetical protein